jgi:hypothetical protein
MKLSTQFTTSLCPGEHSASRSSWGRFHSTGWVAQKRPQPLHCFWPPDQASFVAGAELSVDGGMAQV